MACALAGGEVGVGGPAAIGAGVPGVTGSGALLIAVVGVVGAVDAWLMAGVWRPPSLPPPPQAARAPTESTKIGSLQNALDRNGSRHCCIAAMCGVKQ